MNIAEILKDCPEGTKLYSPIYGEVSYLYIDNNSNYPIVAESNADCSVSFALDGRLDANYDGECMLFPSKENRDWSTFKEKEYEFKPFDKVLVRDDYKNFWHINLFSYIDNDDEYKYICLDGGWKQCVSFESMNGAKRMKECVYLQLKY